MEWIGYLLSIFVGLILGLIGGGGSILSIPILVYIFKLDAVTASAYSLFIVGMTSLVGAIPKYKDHLVDFRTGLLFGVPSIIAIFSTRKWIVPGLPEIILDLEVLVLTKRMLLLGVFALLMIIASLAMIKNSSRFARDDTRNNVFLLIVQGILIGFLTGFVGAGGGFLIIPALVLLTGLPFKTAVGTSLFIIAINALMGFLGDLLNFRIDWPFLLTITSLAIAGILIGHRMSERVAAPRLKRGFGWFVLAIGTFILIREVVFGTI